MLTRGEGFAGAEALRAEVPAAAAGEPAGEMIEGR